MPVVYLKNQDHVAHKCVLFMGGGSVGRQHQGRQTGGGGWGGGSQPPP